MFSVRRTPPAWNHRTDYNRVVSSLPQADVTGPPTGRPPSDPRSVYSALLARRRDEIAMRERRHGLLAYLRLACAIGAVAIVWAALATSAFSVAWVLVPVACFGALLVIHDHLLRALERRRRAARYFERALARLDGHWAGTGETGERYVNPEHPYAQDLDLFGKGSLFELLSTARTHIGEDTLARWLLNPADPQTVAARQAAVDELRPRLDLREDLAVVGEEARTGVDAISLAAWGEAPPLLDAPRLRPILWALTAIGIPGLAAVIIVLANGVGLISLPTRTSVLLRDSAIVIAIVNGQYRYRKSRPINLVVGAVEEAAHELHLLSEVLVRLEREQFHAPLLTALRASLDAAGDPPSRRLATLDKIMERLDSRDNVFVRIADVFLMWTPHQALAVERWRMESGRAVRRWLTAAGEIEALCSLASHAYEHPRDPFPEFVDQPGALAAEGIGHPLIPDAVMVRNSIRAGGDAPPGPRVIIVSGSNMSGKSTLLRTVGINVVLAQAGAPVRARRLGSRRSPSALRFASRFAAGRRRRGSTRRSRASAQIAATSPPGPLPRAVPDRRIPARHQLARPAHRRRSHRARAGGTRRHRAGHHSRPGARAHRRRAGRTRRERTFRRSDRRRPDPLRLRDAAGRGAARATQSS